MTQPRRPGLPTWPALAAALGYGLMEWFALSRSRAVEALGAWRRSTER